MSSLHKQESLTTVLSANHRKLRSASKQAAPPTKVSSSLRALFETSNTHHGSSSSSSSNNNKAVTTTTKAKRALAVVAGKKTESTKKRVHLEKLPKQSTEKLQWLVQRRSSLPRESVLQALQSRDVSSQLGKDCGDEMMRHGANAWVQYEHLELMERLLTMPQTIEGHYRLLQDFASPAMIDHLYATLVKFPDYVQIQHLALKILSIFYHLDLILRQTLARIAIPQAVDPIVRAMQAYTGLEPIQTLGVKIVYQYVNLRPGRNIPAALVAAPGCMEALAAANHCQSNTNPEAQRSIRKTTCFIFRCMVGDMAAKVEHSLGGVRHQERGRLYAGVGGLSDCV